MKKNLLHPAAAEHMVARIRHLQPQAAPLWGTMNATEMLRHCNLCNRQILEGDLPYRKPGFKQHLLKLLALYVAPRFPKHLKGEARNDTRGTTTPDAFSREQAQFISLLQQFPRHTNPLRLTHPTFGPLTNKQWGIAAWKHMDHHLRQFGV